MLRVSSPGQCAQECLQHKEWCRTFTYAPTQCNLYKGSILIANVDPVRKDGTHLYSLSKSVVFVTFNTKLSHGTYQCLGPPEILVPPLRKLQSLAIFSKILGAALPWEQWGWSYVSY